jgi:hypothetical protein
LLPFEFLNLKVLLLDLEVLLRDLALKTFNSGLKVRLKVNLRVGYFEVARFLRVFVKVKSLKISVNVSVPSI